jgi:hypothetical protein
MPYLDVYIYLIAFGVLIGFIRFIRLELLLKTLPFFLLLTLFAECVTPFHLIRFYGNNLWFYNLFTTIEFLYYCFIFYNILHSEKLKIIVLLSAIVFLVFTVINIFWIQGFYRFHTISYRAGALMIVTFCYLYFRQLIQSSEQIILIKNPFFWISTGLLFFYLGFFFYFCAFDYIAYKKVKFSMELFSVISDVLNTLLYSCFVIALICPKKNRL